MNWFKKIMLSLCIPIFGGIGYVYSLERGQQAELVQNLSSHLPGEHRPAIAYSFVNRIMSEDQPNCNIGEAVSAFWDDDYTQLKEHWSDCEIDFSYQKYYSQIYDTALTHLTNNYVHTTIDDNALQRFDKEIEQIALEFINEYQYESISLDTAKGLFKHFYDVEIYLKSDTFFDKENVRLNKIEATNLFNIYFGNYNDVNCSENSCDPDLHNLFQFISNLSMEDNDKEKLLNHTLELTSNTGLYFFQSEKSQHLLQILSQYNIKDPSNQAHVLLQIQFSDNNIPSSDDIDRIIKTTDIREEINPMYQRTFLNTLDQYSPEQFMILFKKSKEIAQQYGLQISIDDHIYNVGSVMNINEDPEQLFHLFYKNNIVFDHNIDRIRNISLSRGDTSIEQTYSSLLEFSNNFGFDVNLILSSQSCDINQAKQLNVFESLLQKHHSLFSNKDAAAALVLSITCSDYLDMSLSDPYSDRINTFMKVHGNQVEEMTNQITLNSSYLYAIFKHLDEIIVNHHRVLETETLGKHIDESQFKKYNNPITNDLVLTTELNAHFTQESNIMSTMENTSLINLPILFFDNDEYSLSRHYILQDGAIYHKHRLNLSIKENYPMFIQYNNGTTEIADTASIGSSEIEIQTYLQQNGAIYAMEPSIASKYPDSIEIDDDTIKYITRTGDSLVIAEGRLFLMHANYFSDVSLTRGAIEANLEFLKKEYQLGSIDYIIVQDDNISNLFSFRNDKGEIDTYFTSYTPIDSDYSFSNPSKPNSFRYFTTTLINQ